MGAQRTAPRPKDAAGVSAFAAGGPLFTSESAEWYSPPHIVDLAVKVLGHIDLDPCSNSQEHPAVPATTHFTLADDGLARRWKGSVYLNPPYGRAITAWVRKLVESYEAGDVSEALALLPARTETVWFRLLRDYPRCFVSGRLRFLTPCGAKAGAPFPSVLVHLGPDSRVFAQVCGSVGDVYERVRTEAA